MSSKPSSVSGEPAPPRPARDRRRLPPARILIAEDEYLIAVQVESDLHFAGFSTVGPFTTLELAIQASRVERFDLALLDINLNGRMVYPVADELMERGVPFIFLTGYLAKDIAERYRALPKVAKPYQLTTLVTAIRRALAAAGR